HAPPASLYLNDPPSPAIYTLSLHDALPIYLRGAVPLLQRSGTTGHYRGKMRGDEIESQESFSMKRIRAFITSALALLIAWSDILDRKSTRLNSSHGSISYAVFCLKNNSSIY